MKKYKEKDKAYYLPLNGMPCEVVHVSDYHDENDDSAIVTVLLENNLLQSIPVVKQAQYLADNPPKVRPTKQQVVKLGDWLAGLPGSLFKFRQTVFCCVLFFAAGAAYGQGIVTKDSSYQIVENGMFYTVRQIEYSNGEATTDKRLDGDTVTVYENAYNRFRQEGVRMANDANEVRKFDTYISRMLSERDFLLAATGRDITDSLAAAYGVPLLITGWTIDDGGGELDITFSITNNGRLRYQIAGFSIRNAFILSNTMRLMNFKDGGRLDLYKARGGNWFSVDDGVKMKFPNNVANRPVRVAPISTEPEPQPVKATTPKKTRKNKKE